MSAPQTEFDLKMQEINNRFEKILKKIGAKKVPWTLEKHNQNKNAK